MSLQYKFFVAAIYAVVLFLDRLDLTIVNITLPTVAKVFHVPLTSTDWVNISFLLALAIAIPISGWLGERFGFKKMYILSMILFGCGSTLCAWAPNLPTLISLRFIHGIGGGMIIPLGMTIIYRIYDKSEWASVTSYTFLPALIAPAIAPFLGGILLDTWNWQVVFLFSGPISLALAMGSFFTLREEKTKNKTPLDIFGFILFSAILADIFYTLSLFGKYENSLLIILDSLLLIVLLHVFIRFENKIAFPLINLHYFKNKNFVKANLIQLCFQICHFGSIFIIGMYLQIGLGMAARLAGFIMGMQAVGAILVSRYSVKLFHRYGAKYPIAIGLFGVGILSPGILFLHNADMVSFALLLFFLRGIFSGLCGVPIQTLSVISFDKEELSTINMLFNAGRQISICLGVAISSSLMMMGIQIAHVNVSANTIIHPENLLTVFGLGFFVIPIVALIGIGIVQSLD